MLDGLFYVFFGIFRTGKWMKDEQSEQDSRAEALKNNYKYYMDKHGVQRVAKTGRRSKKEDHLEDLARAEDNRNKQKYKIYLDYIKSINNVAIHHRSIGGVHYDAALDIAPHRGYLYKPFSFDEWLRRGKPQCGVKMSEAEAEQYISNRR